MHAHAYVLEDITTEPHAQEISADILRVWLSGYILQQYVFVIMCLFVDLECVCGVLTLHKRCMLHACKHVIECMCMHAKIHKYMCISVCIHMCIYVIYLFVCVRVYTYIMQ
jgi:hypothetical protein